MTTTPAFFPVGSKVMLKNLVKGAQYNGEKGKVTGPLSQSSQRQKVFIATINKTKPVNMCYVPRDISSLEREEMITLIKSEAKTKVVVEMEALIIEDQASEGMCYHVDINILYVYFFLMYIYIYVTPVTSFDLSIFSNR